MGAIYEVVDRRTRRRRALKVMLPSLSADPDLRARFELEAQVTANVETEYIVETFDAGIDDDTGAPFIVMELLRGEDLQTTLRERGRVPPNEVIALLDQAASALDRAHEAGVVHRDLKPSNLFVTRRDDGTPRLKILDFGIAKLIAQSTQSRRTTRSLGTPVYMSPEQIRGEGTIDERADVYSIGQIAYALLVGEAYWETEARSVDNVYPLLMKVTQGATEKPTARALAQGVTLPSTFDAWFARATAADASDRAARVGDIVGSLAIVLGVSAASRKFAHVHAPRPSRPWSRAATATAAAVALLGVGGATLMARSAGVTEVRDAPRPETNASEPDLSLDRARTSGEDSGAPSASSVATTEATRRSSLAPSAVPARPTGRRNPNASRPPLPSVPASKDYNLPEADASPSKHETEDPTDTR
jgi:serine/threonine-protein kinase